MSKSKHSKQFKLQVVQDFLSSGTSAIQYSKQIRLNLATLKAWARRYLEHGELAFHVNHSVTTRYTTDFKLSVLRAMQANNLSKEAATALFNIGGNSTLARWQKQYTQGGLAELESKGEYMAAKVDSKKNLSNQNQNQNLTPDQLLLAQKQEEIDYLRAEVAYLKKLDALIRSKRLATKKKR